MKRIFKYELAFEDHQEIQMPLGCKILSVMNQKGTIVVYAIVNDSTKPLIPVGFIIHGTGHPADDLVGYHFLGTVSMYCDSMMFHVFYRINSVHSCM